MQLDNTTLLPPAINSPTEPTCSCHNTQIRLLICSDGRRQYVKQCQVCGRNLGAVPKTTVRVPDLLDPFDETLRERWDRQYRQWLEDRRNYRQQQWETRDSEWWHKYDAYLLTPEWRAKRDRVLERDKHVCQGCFNRRAITAHHLTYAHVTCEFLFELVAVCATCHERLHPVREAG